MPQLNQSLLLLEPQYRERVWGGQKLKAASPPVGEAWVACGPSRVVNGTLAGRTLEDVASEHAPALLGSVVAGRFGPRFPLLIKLLDCADWLSVQVHPNDEQAGRMAGPAESGKTEAWYFIACEPGAQSMIGVRPGVTAPDLASAIRDGRILEVAESLPIEAGDSVLIPAGTLHALGPGLLLYEVQQASDITYRVYDWGRSVSVGRKLHIDESVAVTLAVPHEPVRRPRPVGETGSAPAIECPYFDLDVLGVSPSGGPLAGDTAGRSCHVLTVVDGMAEVQRGTETVRLHRFETVVVTGEAGSYQIVADDEPATLLRAVVPG
ncbi:MAG TPA: type I phosphomannose isomerase catalytic subunit [Candidatus Limnocylindrales bacterium]